MTGWDILDKFIGSFPPIVMALILLAVLTAVVIFIIGFSKHGVNFLKYGFQQKDINDLGVKIDGLDTRLTDKINDLDTRLTDKIIGLDTRLTDKIIGLDTRLTDKIIGLGNEFHTELEAIKVNHFGHLKNFLSELTSILLDKNIINNTEKTRLDNQLRDM